MKKQELTERKRTTKRLKKDYKLKIFNEFEPIFQFLHYAALGGCLREQLARFMILSNISTNRTGALELVEFLVANGFLNEYKSADNIYIFCAGFATSQITGTVSKNIPKTSKSPKNIAFNTLFTETQLLKLEQEQPFERIISRGHSHRNIGVYVARLEQISAPRYNASSPKSEFAAKHFAYAKALYKARNAKLNLDENDTEIINFFSNRAKNRSFLNLSKADLTTFDTLYRSNWRMGGFSNNTIKLDFYDIENRSIGRIYSDALRFAIFFTKHLNLDLKVSVCIKCEHQKRAERRQLEWDDLNKKIQVRKKIACELIGNQQLGLVPQFDKIGNYKNYRILEFKVESLNLDKYAYYRID